MVDKLVDFFIDRPFGGILHIVLNDCLAMDQLINGWFTGGWFVDFMAVGLLGR